jgi:hypothetical protein
LDKDQIFPPLAWGLVEDGVERVVAGTDNDGGSEGEVRVVGGRDGVVAADEELYVFFPAILFLGVFFECCGSIPASQKQKEEEAELDRRKLTSFSPIAARASPTRPEPTIMNGCCLFVVVVVVVVVEEEEKREEVLVEASFVS